MNRTFPSCRSRCSNSRASSATATAETTCSKRDSAWCPRREPQLDTARPPSSISIDTCCCVLKNPDGDWLMLPNQWRTEDREQETLENENISFRRSAELSEPSTPLHGLPRHCSAGYVTIQIALAGPILFNDIHTKNLRNRGSG